MKFHYYFVSYTYSSRKEAGTGNIEMKLANPITTMAEVMDIGRMIEEVKGYPYKSVVVMNFQKLREGL